MKDPLRNYNNPYEFKGAAEAFIRIEAIRNKLTVHRAIIKHNQEQMKVLSDELAILMKDNDLGMIALERLQMLLREVFEDGETFTKDEVWHYVNAYGETMPRTTFDKVWCDLNVQRVAGTSKGKHLFCKA